MKGTTARFAYAVATACLVLAGYGCSSGSDRPDNLLDDVYFLTDANVFRDINGRDDVVGVDVSGQDLIVNPDVSDSDIIVVIDVSGDDIIVNPDLPLVDTDSQPDSNSLPDGTSADGTTNDTDDPKCEGACTRGAAEVWCLPDGSNICACMEPGEWGKYDCADICEAGGMIGDNCLELDGNDNCDCEYDCGVAALVNKQCENMSYTPCTCAVADPCSWAGDGYCDSACARMYPADHYDDSPDCNCTGSCTAEKFNEFCDNDGNACGCINDVKVRTVCADFCASLGGSVKATEPCGTYDNGAICLCENYSCSDFGKVTAQCENVLYTPCTCAVADPCSWADDGNYCDTPSCNQMYPSQTNFDDTATDCKDT